MTSKQRMHRDQLSLNVLVEDARRGTRIGHVVDLSISGLGVSGHREMLEPVGDTELDLVLPWPMHGQERIRLDVRRSWLKEVDGRCHAGFRIVACSDEGQLALEHLSARFADA